MYSEVISGFGNLHCVDDWEKKILSMRQCLAFITLSVPLSVPAGTQGQRTLYSTQSEAMQLLSNDFRTCMPNPTMGRKGGPDRK